MTSRRSFIRGIGIFGLSVKWEDLIRDTAKRIKYADQIDWKLIRKEFPITSWNKIQFNSGSAGVMPIVVRDFLIELIKYINTKAPYEVWNEWQKIKKDNLERLAKMTHSHSQELQIVRNTTEALNMIIYGLPFKRGDEIVISKHDYPFAINAWKNRAAREGLILREIEISIPSDDQTILETYKAEFTSRTKAIHITHLTHREGHIMPVKRLVQLAKENGAFSVVDGAHVVGQIAIDLKNLGCDYFASSLHKWLNAPLGTGLLYSKKDKIASLYNHPSSNQEARDSMEKFEHLGTRAWYNEIGIAAALDFHNLIGTELKSARLNELKNYWTEKVKDIKGLVFQTNISNNYSCAVTTFRIEGFSGGQLTRILDEDYDIHAKSVSANWGSGVRISVNIFTNFYELDRLVAAITDIAEK